MSFFLSFVLYIFIYIIFSFFYKNLLFIFKIIIIEKIISFFTYFFLVLFLFSFLSLKIPILEKLKFKKSLRFLEIRDFYLKPQLGLVWSVLLQYLFSPCKWRCYWKWLLFFLKKRRCYMVMWPVTGNE